MCEYRTLHIEGQRHHLMNVQLSVSSDTQLVNRSPYNRLRYVIFNHPFIHLFEEQNPSFTWNNITTAQTPHVHYYLGNLSFCNFLLKRNECKSLINMGPHLKHREQPYAPCIPAGLGVVLKRQLRGTDLCGQGKFARGHGAWSNAWSFEPTLRWWTNGVEMEKN